MDRKGFFLKQRLKYMLGFFFAFVLIFSAFDAILYNSLVSAQFSEIDKEYRRAGNVILSNSDSALESFLSGKKIVYTNSGSFALNIRTYVLIRDVSGKILNKSYLQAFDYLFDIPFSTQDAFHSNTASVSRRNTEIYFRTYTIPVTYSTTGEQFYVQLVCNATDTVTMLENFSKLMFRAIIVLLLLSIVASWFLGGTLMRSFTKMWDKQDEFISFASHEIRSPLTVIHNSLELLLQEPRARIIEKSDEIIKALRETSRLNKMTANLLSMASMQSPEFRLSKEYINMDEVIAQLADPFIMQAESQEKTMEIKTNCVPYFYADKQLITELIVILVENAIKYTNPKDKIGLSAETKDNKLIIKVSDTGIGISDEALEEVFSRFYRESRARKVKDGSGLGLYLAFLIVNSHGGSIKATHNQPRGTVFTVVLPYKKK